MSNDFYSGIYNPDVLSCLANLSNDEVFTPPEVANSMLDMLPQDIIVFLNLFQRQYQKRSSIPFSQAGDSILGQLEKALFVHYPSHFGPAAAFRLLPGQTRPSLNS